MGNIIPAAKQKMLVEESDANSANSEAFNSKVGGNINYLLDEVDKVINLPMVSIPREILISGTGTTAVSGVLNFPKSKRIYLPKNFDVKAVQISARGSLSASAGKGTMVFTADVRNVATSLFSAIPTISTPYIPAAPYELPIDNIVYKTNDAEYTGNISDFDNNPNLNAGQIAAGNYITIYGNILVAADFTQVLTGGGTVSLFCNIIGVNSAPAS